MRMIASGPVIPVFSRRLSMAAECGFCAVFKDRGEAYTGLRWACAEAISISPLRLTPGGRRSLKAQQHAGGFDAGPPPSSRVGRGLAKARRASQVRSTC
jgi:hypothetical protein